MAEIKLTYSDKQAAGLQFALDRYNRETGESLTLEQYAQAKFGEVLDVFAFELEQSEISKIVEAWRSDSNAKEAIAAAVEAVEVKRK